MKFRSNQAIYLQIGDYVCENILLKLWKEGDRLPSVRELAVNIEVNPNTVMHTYSFLQDKGIIFNQRGKGYFVADSAFDNTNKLKRKDFIKNELPYLFKTMDLLNLSFTELKNHYTKYKTKRGDSK